ncbi:hypothetical protein LCGC14_2240740 [marine sediment metagenome]|uniref:Uncharacterized protein n=1 Tax=marine sediment metagenome TaxID=412755 RepID=A0A0F9D595_9ZZZZ
MADTDRVVRALASVPRKSLLIIEMTRSLVLPDGQLDHNLAAEKAPEINLAVAEAQVYSRATARAITALKSIQARAL